MDELEYSQRSNWFMIKLICEQVPESIISNLKCTVFQNIDDNILVFIYLFGVLHGFQHCKGNITCFCGQRKPVHIYSWSRFYTVTAWPSVSNYQLFHIRSRVRTTNLRGGRRVCYHCATMTTIFQFLYYLLLGFSTSFELPQIWVAPYI